MPDIRAIRSLVDAFEAAEPLIRKLLTSPDPERTEQVGPTIEELRAFEEGTVIVSSDGEQWTKRPHAPTFRNAPTSVWQGERMYLTHTNLRREYDTLEVFDPAALGSLSLQSLKVGTQVRGNDDKVWTKKHGSVRPWSNGTTYRTGTELCVSFSPLSLLEPGLTVDELRAFKPTTQVIDRTGRAWTRQYLLKDSWATADSHALTSANLHREQSPITLHRPANDGLFSDELEGLPAGAVVQDARGGTYVKDESGYFVRRTNPNFLRANYGPITLISEPEQPEGLSADTLDAYSTGAVVVDASGQHWTAVRTLRDRKMRLVWMASERPSRTTKQLLEQHGPIFTEAQ